MLLIIIKKTPMGKKNLETRSKEHFRNHRLNHTDKSAIALHLWNTRHEINNSANLLKSVNRKYELIIWEKIFIHKHAHQYSQYLLNDVINGKSYPAFS